ncbi:hypothetical protein FA15DRAFT_674365 [Coprinopsis marcescibilis]|uniref:Uncharacterized protein n=1 Tax=Coprinopsis marcescibilis TaxID=230819 RepID=A0A5C3KH34_COPMA|nr:hypothetical protein FA15DRAFT_674365 [Coprinopsis marcescibilis]
MEARYAFPVGKAPIPRTRPVNTTPNSRESNALRASVLDAAMELGITNNSVVAAWMFDNTLKEEEEDEEEAVSSPGLTNRSSAPSEESTSYQYPSTPPDIASGAGKLPANGKYGVTWTPSTFDGYDGAEESRGNIAFPTGSDPQITTRPTTPSGFKKLKKKNRDNGYDSDGGYLSEGAKKISKKEAKAKLKEEKREQKEEERKRKKSLTSVLKPGKKTAEASGYETDGAASSSKSPFKSMSKKSKKDTTPNDGGYDTDGGYVSSGSNMKKKKGFFSLRSKSSRSDLHEEVPDMPVPPLPNGYLPPIAGRFATSLGALSPELPSISPSQPLTFESLPISSSSPASATPPPHIPDIPDRSSLASGESSSSNQQRPSLFSTPSRDDGSSQAHHGAGAGSISTINSSINSSSHGSNGHSVYESASSQTPVPTAPPQRPPRSPTSPMTGSLRPPLPISFPLTRAASPIPPVIPVTPLNILKNSDPYSRGPSPLPPFVPSASPYPGQSSSLSDSTSSNPSRDNYINPLPPSASLSSLPPRAETPVRPRRPPVDGFGPRNARSPSPQPPTNNLLSPTSTTSQTTLRSRALSPLLVPQNPNSDVSPLPSPSTHRYSDIPPPNPPPMGPLPSVPVAAMPPVQSNFGPPPSSHLRHQAVERPKGRELSVSMQPIQRGREAPFPSRPIISPPPIGSSTDMSDAYGGIAEARPMVPRYPPVVNGLGRFAGTNSGTPSPPSSSAGPPQLMRRPSTAIDSPKLSPVGDAPRPMIQQQSHRVHWEAGLMSPAGSGSGILPVAQRPGYPGSLFAAARLDDSAVDDDYISDGEEDLRNVIDRMVDGSAEGSGESVYDSVSHGDHVPPRSLRTTQTDPGYLYSSTDYIVGEPPSNVPDRNLNSSSQPPDRRLLHQRSFETNRRPDPKHDSFAVSEYYGWDDASMAMGNRESRWSGSIYSRVSILDPDQSEETRDRFVRRVEAMLATKDREIVPPVPKIPEGVALANAGSLNRF